MRRGIWALIILLVIIFMLFGNSIARFYTDWLWFGEVGYKSVFLTRLITRLSLGLIVGAFSFLFVYLNLWLARRLAPPIPERYITSQFRRQVGRIAKLGFTVLILGSTLALSMIIGAAASRAWLSYQMFTHPVSFGTVDPIFHNDIGFYVFKLNFLKHMYGWLIAVFILAFIGTALVDYADKAIEFFAGTPRFMPHVKAHLSFLFSLILFAKAWGYRLDAYNLLYSPYGVVFGAGYTDVHARLLAYNVLSLVAIVAGLIALANIYRRGIVLPLTALGVLVAASFLLGVLYPAFVQQVYVKPNEIKNEYKYIRYNIDSTRRAFNLDKIVVRDFPASKYLTPQDVERNRATINSIRLWDYRPLKQTYSQLQELGPYYKIENVDVDRYVIDGYLRQVMLAARELVPPPHTTAAGSWVNRHFQYTHGYGAVMSPVNTITEEGQPEFFIEGIPPYSRVGIEISRPQIYFGEMTYDYVIANSATKEFDHPAERGQVYNRYDGKGGIPVAGYLRRMAFSMRFGDINLLLKNPIASKSRLMFRRDIQSRVKTIFPYLVYDPDPYLVISNGKLYWIWDGYTASGSYPYSTPTRIGDLYGANYVRNAVKVVIDAYDGTVNYYIADESDPIIKSYARIFKGVFKPLAQMPRDLRMHIRYPELLFRVQAEMMLAYHTEDVQVLYAKSDLWAIPNEIVGTSGEPSQMEPYYVVMTLPGETKEEFLIMIPFTFVGKDNMVAWMAAQSNPSRMVLYQFPRKELVYGPAQIETRINQDAAISQLLTLWSREGSRVNRGNQLVIPIGQSIIYVKPLYLESETSKIPELKRVIVAHGNRLVMGETLDEALAKLFGIKAPTRGEIGVVARQAGLPPALTESVVGKLAREAASYLERAKGLQRQGDWAGYGEQMNKLEQTLKRLREVTGAK